MCNITGYEELDHRAIAFIEDTVLDYMRTNTSFTSLDIANLAKERGYYARNRWVAAWLRSNAIRVAHQYGHLYNQTLIQVDSKADGQTLAYLYHNMHASPDSYLDRDQNPKSYRVSDDVLNRVTIPTPVVRPTTPPTAQPLRSDHHSNYQRRDSRGRFV